MTDTTTQAVLAVAQAQQDAHTPHTPHLTCRQKEQKIVFCLTAAAASIVLALWGFARTLDAASTGTLSVLHLASLIGGMLMARVFTRIAYRA